MERTAVLSWNRLGSPAEQAVAIAGFLPHSSAIYAFTGRRANSTRISDISVAQMGLQEAASTVCPHFVHGPSHRKSKCSAYTTASGEKGAVVGDMHSSPKIFFALQI